MMFNTPEFAVLLLVSLAVYYWLPERRIWIVTAANLAFYGIVGPGYLLLFGFVSAVTFCCALGMESRFRKVLLFVGIAIPAGNLVFFKYSDFLFRILERLLSVQLVSHEAKWLHLALPLGISFYTFELISYLVDVYKGKLQPERSILRFWIFITFFAHMIAGPIMRGNEFLPQVAHLRAIRFSSALWRKGVFFICLGLIKKMGISDSLAPYCDSFFAHAGELNGGEGWTAAVLYAFQIYCDFSGYSDMAVGIGLLFGLELAVNFRTPYLSANATEFWRRWHITLSSWIRDYIYIPLGGSRAGSVRQYANLFAAMTLSGLWHGNQATFVAWGMYQGVLSVVHKLYSKLLKKLDFRSIRENWIYRVLAVAVFFFLTCLGWVLFRVNGLHNALSLLSRMLSSSALVLPRWVWGFWLLAAGLYVLHAAEYWLLRHLDRISSFWHRWFPPPLRAAVYTVLICLFILLMKHEQSSFIYFQF
jgi:alginate O-acetyltransferase complex protein AlgI